MKTNIQLGLFLSLSILAARGQGTAFTYQGRLNDGTGPANGIYDLQFAVFDASTNGTQIGSELTNSSTTVSNGLFTVLLDFGDGVFTGTNRWLEIGVRTNGAGAFSTLAPRQPITPTPYAIFAEGANAAGISGTIPAANLGGTYNGAVNFNNGADSFDGTFYGAFYGASFIGGDFVGSFIGNGSGLSGVWLTSGNSGTTPGAQFVGTTDNQPLELHVNKQRALMLLPDISTNNAPDVVGGSLSNAVSFGLVGNTIGGGSWNTIGPALPFSINNPYGDNPSYPAIGASYSTIGGGFLNQIQAGATFSTVAGGAINTIETGNIESTISGGFNNTISTNASWSTINGGTYHTIESVNGFIGGGWANTIQGGSGYSTIAGGSHNTVQTNSGYSTIAGGYFNQILTNSTLSFIGGGDGNMIQSNCYYSVIGGGTVNLITAPWAVIAGGYFNTNAGLVSFVGAGDFNSIQANYSAIGGGYANAIQLNSYESDIGGGYFNTVQSNSSYSTIGGGQNNVITAPWAVIAGGYFNTNSGFVSFIGAGDYNYAAGSYSAIGAGLENVINGFDGVIGGGYSNVVNGYLSDIGGGLGNTIQYSASYAVIPGGSGNVAGGLNSFAAGSQAQAFHDGAFVWSDTSSTNAFNSTGTNQFLIRAAGGVGIGTNSPAAALEVAAGGTGTNMALRIDNGGIAVSGAGIGTHTAAFTQLSAATNVFGDYTVINNPLCNGDPNALLFVTHNWNPPNGTTTTYFNKNFGVFYTGTQWAIFTEDLSAMPTNIAFNVLVIKR